MAAASAAAASPRSLQELVAGPGFEPARRALAPFYLLRQSSALARIPPLVAQKYGSSGERQSVITVTDRLLLRQTCWNPQRGQKPQNFASKLAVVGGSNGNASTKAAAAAASPPPLHHALDPLLNGSKASCDFCAPETATAEDVPFGRYVSPSPAGGAVSASNLFKCAAPYHGVVLLPHRHDPLALSRADVAAALDCARGWFSLAADAAAANAAAANAAAEDTSAPPAGRSSSSSSGRSLHPFLLWNALPRAGASQYHAHAQTTLTDDPVPEQTKLWRAERAFAAAAAAWPRRRQEQGEEEAGAFDSINSSSNSNVGAGGCYYSELLRAKAAAGLLRVVTARPARGGDPPSSSSSSSASSSSSLASLLLLDSSSSDGRRGAGGARVAPDDGSGDGDSDNDDDAESAAVAFVYAALAPVKDAELVVVVPAAGDDAAGGVAGGGNLSALRAPALSRALHAALRAAVDGVGVGSGAFNAAVLNLEVGGAAAGRVQEEDDEEAPPPWPPYATDEGNNNNNGASPHLFSSGRPLVARVVSRGPPTAAASDFGALEVMGGASIGHTDPYRLLELFDAALEAADGERGGQEEEEKGQGAAATALRKRGVKTTTQK